MSLINDALKRAKQATPAGASADGPVLQAVEPAPAARGGGAELAAALLLGVVLVLGATLLWQWFYAGSAARPAGKIPIAAIPRAAIQVVAPVVVPQAQPSAVQPPQVEAPAASSRLPEPATGPVDATPNALATATVVEPAKPAPPVYKLQSVFYRAKNPSAMINGKDVSVGSRVADAQVLAIGRGNVTLVTSTGQTNILELP